MLMNYDVYNVFFEASTNLSDLLKAVFVMFLYCFRPF